jgi:SPP1 gp7 family putative phage head morphogenesis protein
VRPPRHPPAALDQVYARTAIRRLAALRRMVEALVQASKSRPRRDAVDELDDQAEAKRAAIVAAQTIRAELVGLRRAWSAAMPAPAGLFLPLAANVDAFVTNEVDVAVGRAARVAAIDIEAPDRVGGRSRAQMRELHETWSREGAELIGKVERETIDEIAELTARAVANGDTDLGAILEQRFGIARRRANLIARDQIGKLNSRITRARQEEFGITEYTWSTAGDERVRPLHRKRDGKRFRWSDPPSDGAPGEPIQCRCVAIPIIPGLD